MREQFGRVQVCIILESSKYKLCKAYIIHGSSSMPSAHYVNELGSLSVRPADSLAVAGPLRVCLRVSPSVHTCVYSQRKFSLFVIADSLQRHNNNHLMHVFMLVYGCNCHVFNVIVRTLSSRYFILLPASLSHEKYKSCQ